MEYQLALSPQVGLTASEFVQEWNESEEARTLAEAHLVSSKSASFDPLLDAIALLGTIGVGVGTNALYDVIKKVVLDHLAKKKTTTTSTHKHTHITQVDQPDGTHILVVDIEE